MKPVNEIAQILTAAGHETTRVGVRHDLRWLRAARAADLIFNLCEGINGIGKWEDLVAATIELARIPSTGAKACSSVRPSSAATPTRNNAPSSRSPCWFGRARSTLSTPVTS